MFDNLDDPRKQAMLAMAFGLLGGQGGKGAGGFARDLGQAGLLGLNRFAVANEDKRRSGLVEDQRKMQQFQFDQAKRGAEDQDFARQIAPNYFSPQVSPLTPNDDEGNPMPSSQAKADFMGYGQALAARNPQMGAEFMKLAPKPADSAFSKIDPKDYTPESIRRFAMSAQSGKPDFSILEPVRKREVSGGRAYDPYAVAPGTDVLGPESGVVPAAGGGYRFNPAKINPVEVANFNLSRAKAADEGVGGLPGIPGFMTGNVTGPIQRGPSPQAAQQGAPQTPASPPVGVPGLSPKQAREIAGKTALDRVAAQSALPNVTAEAKQTLGLIDKMVSHPGLGDVVGAKWAGGLTTLLGLPPVAATDAADFEAMREQLTGKQFLQAYESLKGSGQITEIEGAKATNAIARMQTAQSEKAFKEAAQEFRDVIESGLSRARAKAGASGESQAAPQTKPVKIGNKQYEAKIGKGGKYYVQIGSRYFEVSE